MKQAKVLTRAELKRVMSLCEVSRNGKRNRLAVTFSHFAGMRVGEIAALKWAHVLDQDRHVKGMFYLDAAYTKSREARQVHINRNLQKQITSYLGSLGRFPGLASPVISSQKGGPFSANSLCQLFRRIYTDAGIDHASSHSGRRWFITRLAHSGVSPKVIMELAGHKQLTTTQRYIEVDDAMKSKAVECL